MLVVWTSWTGPEIWLRSTECEDALWRVLLRFTLSTGSLEFFTLRVVNALARDILKAWGLVGVEKTEKRYLAKGKIKQGFLDK
jgi:hypothetical protein